MVERSLYGSYNPVSETDAVQYAVHSARDIAFLACKLKEIRRLSITHDGSGKIHWCTGQGLCRMYRKAGFLQIPQPGYPVCSIYPVGQLFLTLSPALRRLLIWSPQLTLPRGRISHRYLRC